MKKIKRLLPYIIIIGGFITYCYYLTLMPGKSYEGRIESGEERVQVLYNHVRKLTQAEHNMLVFNYLQKNKEYIIETIKDKGFTPILHNYTVNGLEVSNIEVIIPGRVTDSVVIGAHYDSAEGTVGANDNASGVAVLLELVNSFTNPYNTIRLVWFVNEEPPYFKTQYMGSYVYAKELFERGENVVAMYSFDMLGAFYEQSGTQKYPPPFSLFYPRTGNFLGFVGNFSSADLVKSSILAFRQSGVRLASEGIAAPAFVRGIDYSDNWSFYQFNYPAIMITDTSFNRYKHYHKDTDTIDKLNFKAMNEVLNGLEKTFNELYGRAPK